MEIPDIAGGIVSFTRWLRFAQKPNWSAPGAITQVSQTGLWGSNTPESGLDRLVWAHPSSLSPNVSWDWLQFSPQTWQIITASSWSRFFWICTLFQAHWEWGRILVHRRTRYTHFHMKGQFRIANAQKLHTGSNLKSRSIQVYCQQRYLLQHHATP